MEQWIAGLLADSFPPEKPKFKSPLILVHGLWTGSWCWQSWATHFCNLGWESHAVNLRGRVEPRPFDVLKGLGFDDCVQDLKRAVRSCSFPPVLLGHSLGALLALKAAEDEPLSALILVSPPAPPNFAVARSRAHRLLRLKYLPSVFFRRPFRLEEKDFRSSLMTALPPSIQNEIINRTVVDSSRLARDFLSPGVDVEPRRLVCPSLVLAGEEDKITPPTSSRELARRLGADSKVYAEQGHWMIEQNGEAIVRDIHRWLVRKLSDEILLAEFP